MKPLARRTIQKLLDRFGYQLQRKPRLDDPWKYPPDFDAELRALCEKVRPYTLTSPERIASLRESVRYLVGADVPGAFVECGVWRGGSMMVVASTLRSLGITDRDLYLFDTFTHMPRPDSEHDVDMWGKAVADTYDEAVADSYYEYLPLEGVKEALAGTGYPLERMHFVQGLVEDTIPDQAPDTIALCRLDTDYYTSTAHDMEHLYPRIVPGGLLLIDDYGHYRGARQAVDEYFDAHGIKVLLQRIDYTARLVVKPAG